MLCRVSFKRIKTALQDVSTEGSGRLSMSQNPHHDGVIRMVRSTPLEVMDGVSKKLSQMVSHNNAKDKRNAADPRLKKAGCVVVGLATAAAAPYVVPAAVSTIGFTKVGVAAGSAAAYMMSVTGTSALGMPVMAAIQSVGAAGLGIKGAVVAGLLGYKAADKIAQRSKEPVVKSKL